MKNRGSVHIRNLGRLDSYVELLKTGIRDICLPNFGYSKIEDLDYIREETRKHGLCSMLVTFHRTKPNGDKFKSYQRIIYCKGRKAKAEQLRKKLTYHPKKAHDHREIGKLLGYNNDAISSFIESLK